MPYISGTCTTEQKDRFLQQLRTATTPMHKQLESGKLSVNLVKDNVSVSDYTAYLHRMKDIVQFYEEEIFPLVQDVIPAVDTRRKLHMINTDLAALNKNNQQYHHTYIPFAESTDLAFALGYMYVMEGSTLGGRVILKHIHSKLNIDASNGGMFFTGYKEETGSRWKEFLDILCTYAVEEEQEAGVIEGAKHAFNSIHEHLARP